MCVKSRSDNEGEVRIPNGPDPVGCAELSDFSLDGFSLIADHQSQIVNAEMAENVQMPFEQGFAVKTQERLRAWSQIWTEARTKTGGEHRSLHSASLPKGTASVIGVERMVSMQIRLQRMAILKKRPMLVMP